MLICEITKAPPRLKMGVDRLQAAAQEMASWKDWYDRHTSLVNELFDEDAKLFSALLAATSQRTSVYVNVPLALKAYQQLKKGQPFQGFMAPMIPNLERIRGEQALFGPKITQFAGAMDNQADKVAVDMHIGELLFGNPRPTLRQVERAKQVITQIAQKLGWQPREVQASLWAYNKMNRGEKPETVHTYATILNNKRQEIGLIRKAFQEIQQEPIAA